MSLQHPTHCVYPVDMTTAADHIHDYRAMSTGDLLGHLSVIASAAPIGEDGRAAMAEAIARLNTLTLDRDQAERTTPVGTTTLEHVKLYLRAHWSEGLDCPACKRNVKLHAEKLSRNMAQGLVAQYRAVGCEMVDTRDIWPTTGTSGPKTPQLKHWGIIEKGERARHWRITDKGAEWIHGLITVPMYALTYNDTCWGFRGDPVSLADALETAFDLDELLAARPFPSPSDPSPTLFGASL